jgi:hypothetical protein
MINMIDMIDTIGSKTDKGRNVLKINGIHRKCYGGLMSQGSTGVNGSSAKMNVIKER